jgi:hypothetical protein
MTFSNQLSVGGVFVVLALLASLLMHNSVVAEEEGQPLPAPIGGHR